jgi:hypothetical protein
VCEEISVGRFFNHVLNKATSKRPSYMSGGYVQVVDVLAALKGDLFYTENEENLYKAKYVTVVEVGTFWSVDLQYFQRTIHTKVSAHDQSTITSDVLLRIFYSSQDWMIQEIKKVVDVYYSTDFQRLQNPMQSEQLFDSICIEC